MAWLQDFHFLRPWWLIGLFLPLLIYVIAYRQTAAQSAWRKVCDENLLDFLLVKNEKLKKTKFSSFLLALISLFLVLALAGPTWIKKEQPALSVENPVMILLNMSGEMWNKDVSPSRIERAKYVIKDLTKALNNTESGLIVYSKEPFRVTPLVEDVSIIDNMLPALQMNIMPEDGDRLDRAIDFAVSRMQESGVPSGNLIVITSNVGERFDAALTAAAKAAEHGFEVNIINVSAKAVEKLEMVAEKGQGVFLNYNQSYALLIKKINDITAKEIKQSKNMQTVWEDMGWYLLWIPALLLLGRFRKGAAVLLLCLLFGTNAYAGWFLNDNQEAMREFDKQNYAAAAEKFTDLQWKAAAEYKNGNYQEAYEKYAQNDDAVSLYNQGNALAKGGKIDEAIKKYEEALQKQADFPDAKFNLEYLKKQKQQQNQQQKQDKQNQKQQNKEQQKQQQSAQNGASQQQADEKQEQNKQNQQENGEQQKQQSGQQAKADGNDQQQADSQQGSEKQDKIQQTENEQKNNETRQSESNSNKPDKKSDKENEADVQQQAGEDKKGEEQQQQAIGVNGKQSPEVQEKMRAKLQKFRQIPDDKGGLLRALIQKEYAKRRYEK